MNPDYFFRTSYSISHDVRDEHAEQARSAAPKPQPALLQSKLKLDLRSRGAVAGEAGSSWDDFQFSTTQRDHHRAFPAVPSLEQSVHYKRAPNSARVNHVESYATCYLAQEAEKGFVPFASVTGPRGTSYGREFHPKQVEASGGAAHGSERMLEVCHI
jgi:hypothetical protein